MIKLPQTCFWPYKYLIRNWARAELKTSSPRGKLAWNHILISQWTNRNLLLVYLVKDTLSTIQQREHMMKNYSIYLIKTLRILSPTALMIKGSFTVNYKTPMSTQSTFKMRILSLKVVTRHSMTTGIKACSGTLSSRNSVNLKPSV